MKSLLPIGSVVLLIGSARKVMITGRYQRESGQEGRVWDYSGCLYPEGVLDPEQSFLFNNDQVERVYFIGFQDDEELAFLDFLAREDPEFMNGDGR